MKSPVGVLAVGLATLVSWLPLQASAWWTGQQSVQQVYAGYSSKSVYVTMNGTTCSQGIVQFSTASSDPDKIEPLAIAALLSGKKLECAISSCDASGYGVGSQCRLIN